MTFDKGTIETTDDKADGLKRNGSRLLLCEDEKRVKKKRMGKDVAKNGAYKKKKRQLMLHALLMQPRGIFSK